MVGADFWSIQSPLTELTYRCIIPVRCGVEQRQLVGLITRRSQVRILAPLPRSYQRPSGYPELGSPTVFVVSDPARRRFLARDRRPSALRLSKELVGVLQYKTAEGRNSSTLTTYESHLRLWVSHAGGIQVSDVAARNLRGFLA